MYKGLIEMLLATFLWGSTPLMAIYSNLPSSVFVFFRVLFAFPFIFYVALKKAGIKEFFKPPFLPLFLSGVFLGVNWIFFFLAIKSEKVSVVVSIYYLGPLISMFLAFLFLKEKITKHIIIGALLALFGAFLVAGEFELRGVLFAFLAALSYGLLGFFSKIATLNHRAVVVTAWQIFISIFLTFPFLFFSEWSFSLGAFFISLIAGIFHTALALFLWYDALNYIKVSIASTLQYLDIVFAIFLSYVFLHQIPTFLEVLGAFLIILGGIVSLKRQG